MLWMIIEPKQMQNGLTHFTCLNTQISHTRPTDGKLAKATFQKCFNEAPGSLFVYFGPVFCVFHSSCFCSCTVCHFYSSTVGNKRVIAFFASVVKKTTTNMLRCFFLLLVLCDGRRRTRGVTHATLETLNRMFCDVKTGSPPTRQAPIISD